MPATQSASFLQRPAELRVAIYEMLLPDPQLLAGSISGAAASYRLRLGIDWNYVRGRFVADDGGPVSFGAFSYWSQTIPAIQGFLFSCHQIRKECCVEIKKDLLKGRERLREGFDEYKRRVREEVQTIEEERRLGRTSSHFDYGADRLRMACLEIVCELEQEELRKAEVYVNRLLNIGST